MENEKNMILELQSEDGTSVKRELISIFESNGHQYAALLPVDDNEKVIEGASVELVRADPYQDEEIGDDYMLSEIKSDEELEAAKSEFEKLFAAQIQVDNLDELQTLTFTKDDGSCEQWKVLDLFEHSNHTYIALISADVNPEVENTDINLMRAELKTKDGIEECDVYAIPTDEEYEEAANVFEQRIVLASKT